VILDDVARILLYEFLTAMLITAGALSTVGLGILCLAWLAYRKEIKWEDDE
jgi:hypothetical protein